MSEFVKRVLIEGGVPEVKITVVYDGVPLLDPAGGPVVLAPAAQADPRKGTALAIEAARIAGVPLELAADFEHDLRRARLLVYITHSEGLGSAVLLAMSAGVPVIASKVGGLVEIIRPEENGLLVDNEPAQIAGAIRRCSTTRVSHAGWAMPAAGRSSRNSPKLTWFAVPWRFTGRCSLDGSRIRAVVRTADRQFSECLHPPLAPRPVGGPPAVALRPLPQDHRVVRQHSGRELPAARWQLPVLRPRTSRSAIRSSS